MHKECVYCRGADITKTKDANNHDHKIYFQWLLSWLLRK